ncbi:MAG: glycosyltransferase family 39 protein [Terriglobales bacterium]
MLGIFHRDRFGRPQIIAILFLLAFLFQGLWVLHHVPLAADELALIRAGRAQWRSGIPAGNAVHSPLAALAASAPLLFETGAAGAAGPPLPLRWLARLPFVFCSLMLAGSLWYVARRLYGNPGGYIALALYCFAPLAVVHAARVDAAAPAAWGLFGSLFTAIALAHTLYAPPRDRLRRALLLGVALGMGVGAEYSVALVIPLLLALVFYLSPRRRKEALALLGLSGAIVLLLLWSSYFFGPVALLQGLQSAHVLALRPALVAGGIAYRALVPFLVGHLPAMLLLALALYTLLRSPRSRYFGNIVPILAASPLFLASLSTPYYLSVHYLVLALPFLALFIAGVFADLLEEAYEGPSARLARRVLLTALFAHAALGLWMLPQLAGT